MARCGTAASEVRIMPVLYSLATTRTPKTIIASWPRVRPEKEMNVGSKVSLSAVERFLNSFFDRALISMPSPTETITARLSVRAVEFTDLILVHSDRRTWAAAISDAPLVAVAAVVALALLPGGSPALLRLLLRWRRRRRRAGVRVCVVLDRLRRQLHERLLRDAC